MNCQNCSMFCSRVFVNSAKQKKTHQPKDHEALVVDTPRQPVDTMSCDSGRERLKRYRIEMAGNVWIPEIWGQEEMLKEWIDCKAFDEALVPRGITSARAALVEEGRRVNSTRLRIENRR